MQVVLAVLLFVYGNSIKESLVTGVGALWNKRKEDVATDGVFKNIQEQVNTVFLFTTPKRRGEELSLVFRTT